MSLAPRFLILALAILVPMTASGQEAVMNTTCPVMPLEEVNAESEEVTFRGKKIRLCCDKCVQKFQADPERYLDRLPQFAPGTDEIAAKVESSQPPPRPAPDGLWRTIGKLHVLVIHFPIALILVAAVLEALSMLKRRVPYGPEMRPLMIIAGLSSIAAVASGLVHADHETLAPSLEKVLFWHRVLGIATAVLASGAAILGEVSRRSEGSRMRLWYRLVLLAAAVTVALTGHDGGAMVFGQNYL